MSPGGLWINGDCGATVLRNSKKFREFDCRFIKCIHISRKGRRV